MSTPDRRPADRHDRQRPTDSGFTMVELLVVLSMLGVLAVAVSSGIITMLRSAPVVKRSISESHDQQQLTDYFVGDARSTTAQNVDYSTTAVGCPGATDGLNLIQFTFRTNDANTWRRVNYRLIPGATTSTLDRIQCGGLSAQTMTPGTTSRTNIADALAAAPAGWTNLMAPAVLTPPGAAGSGSENLVSVELTRTRGLIKVTASLAQFSAQPVPASTTPTSNVPVVTTTSSSTTLPPTTPVTQAPTTSSIVVTPTQACALLGDLVVSAQANLSVTPPAAATNLLRNSVTGALMQTYRVTASLNVTFAPSAAGVLNLNVTPCASVQMAYNTGTVAVQAPTTATATCTAPAPPAACATAKVDVYIDLPATAAEKWVDGSRPVTLVRSTGAPLNASSAGAVTVQTDPTTTTTTIPATTPTVPAGAALNPIVAAQGFSILAESDATLGGLNVGGGVAAGGNITFKSYGTIASTASPTFRVTSEPEPTSLLAGGKIDLANSDQMSLNVARGFVHAGNNTDGQSTLDNGKLVVNKPSNAGWQTPRVLVDGANQTDLLANPVVRPNIFPFTTAFASLRSSTARMAALNPTSTCSSVAYPQLAQTNGQWVLNLVTGKVNVLNLTASTYNSLENVNGAGIADATTYIIVNILDYGTVNLATKYWNQFQNGRKASILFNFPNATAVNVANAFYGTLFAPNAAVNVNAIQLEGDLIGKSFVSNSGTIAIARFDTAVPCIG